jgi:hypothetical protein
MKGIQQEQTEAIENLLIPENPVQEKEDARFESSRAFKIRPCAKVT